MKNIRIDRYFKNKKNKWILWDSKTITTPCPNVYKSRYLFISDECYECKDVVKILK